MSEQDVWQEPQLIQSNDKPYKVPLSKGFVLPTSLIHSPKGRFGGLNHKDKESTDSELQLYHDGNHVMPLSKLNMSTTLFSPPWILATPPIIPVPPTKDG